MFPVPQTPIELICNAQFNLARVIKITLKKFFCSHPLNGDGNTISLLDLYDFDFYYRRDYTKEPIRFSPKELSNLNKAKAIHQIEVTNVRLLGITFDRLVFDFIVNSTDSQDKYPLHIWISDSVIKITPPVINTTPSDGSDLTELIKHYSILFQDRFPKIFDHESFFKIEPLSNISSLIKIPISKYLSITQLVLSRTVHKSVSVILSNANLLKDKKNLTFFGAQYYSRVEPAPAEKEKGLIKNEAIYIFNCENMEILLSQILEIINHLPENRRKYYLKESKVSIKDFELLNSLYKNDHKSIMILDRVEFEFRVDTFNSFAPKPGFKAQVLNIKSIEGPETIEHIYPYLDLFLTIFENVYFKNIILEGLTNVIYYQAIQDQVFKEKYIPTEFKPHFLHVF